MGFFKTKKSTNAKSRYSNEARGFIPSVDVAERDFPITNANLFYGKSCIAGIGVFNRYSIAPNRKITEYTGEILHKKKQLISKEKYYKNVKHISSTYFFKIKYKDTYVDATMVGNEGRFINHSCCIRRI